MHSRYPPVSIMVQGTTSDAGKSLLVAGLCRTLANLGYSVAPFKPQNMALNSAVTLDGGEIGRAQALQAIAAKTPAQTDMNPILLKPTSDIGAQVIVHGKAIEAMDACTYHNYKLTALDAVLTSYERLKQQFEFIIVEGAGSPAEINLRDRDIANMGFAEPANCPVIIIADIDKGGVFAHLVGTLALLSQSEQDRVIGFVINKFRGDISLLESGLTWLTEKTGKPVLGVLPYLQGLDLDAEDAINTAQPTKHGNMLNIVVPVLPRISNHTDFDSLRLHPGVNLQFIHPSQPMPACDLVILPGSKNVRADLAFLIEHHWDEHINKHMRYGGKLIGICGGYQMLGLSIDDPLGIEGQTGCSAGLKILPINTTLQPTKILAETSGVFHLDRHEFPFTGYEIHCGTTEGANQCLPLHYHIDGTQHEAGTMSVDRHVWGTYMHGLFDTPTACNAILAWAGLTTNNAVDLEQHRDAQLDWVARTVEEHLDLATLFREASRFDR